MSGRLPHVMIIVCGATCMCNDSTADTYVTANSSRIKVTAHTSILLHTIDHTWGCQPSIYALNASFAPY